MDNKLKKYKIYSLRSYKDKSVIYYDYTTQFLHKRLSAIKSRYTRYLNNMDNYIVSFELFKLGNVYIELEEELECINREHLNAVLNKYIRDNDCLNKSYYDKMDKKDNDNINQQNQLTLYKSTPHIEEIQKDIKNEETASNSVVCDNNAILTNKTDNINTLKEPEIKPPTTSGIVPVKDKLNELITIEPPTISNMKTLDIKNKNKNNNRNNKTFKKPEFFEYSKQLFINNDDNNSIKSLASLKINNKNNNKTIKVNIQKHNATIKKRNL